MATQNKMIKASNRYLNSYDAIYNAVSKKPLFNQEDWIYAANNGTLDVYSNALLNSDNINLNDYQEKYNLEFADSQTRTAALYNEVGANRENTDTKRKKMVTDQDGNTVEEEYLASDYQYNLELIRKQNDYYQEIRNQEVIADMKSSISVGEHILSTGVGIFTGLSQGFLEGLNGLIGLSTAVMDAMTQSDYVTTDTIAESFAKVQEGPVPNMIQDIVNFESNYTTLRNDDGSYTTLGKYVGGISTSLGQMIPSMAIGYGVSGIAGAGKLASTVSQASFYGGMASNNIQDSYAQYIQNGADIDSAAILANAGIKSTLQWAIERGLGKLLGTTSLDSMVFGRAQSGITSKTLTAAGLENIFKDFLQEGLEEVFQDTSDFLVDEAFEMFIKEYKNTSEISWQSLLDAFIIGGFMSFAGSATKILSTRNIYAGDTKLNKIASWQYGLNMETLSNTMSTIEKITNRNDVTLSERDQRIVRAATLECYAAYRTVTSIYNEIGEKRFKDANDVLDKITEKIRTGAFDKKTAEEYVTGIKDQLKGLSEATIKKIAKEMQEAGVTEIKAVINADTEKTDPESVKVKQVAKVLGVEKVAITDGDLFLKTDEGYVISGNNLNKDVGELLRMDGVRLLIDSIDKNFVKDPAYTRLVPAFEEFYGRTVTSREALLALFYDKDFFSSTLLKENKDGYKFLSYFVQLGKDLKENVVSERVQRNLVNKIINNWVESLTEYCIVHREADPSLFLYAIVDSKKRKIVEDKIKRERWGGEMHDRILRDPNSLSDSDKVVLKNRIKYAYPADSVETVYADLLSGDFKTRQRTISNLSRKYYGLFTSQYDNETYPVDNSIPNRLFIKFLRERNLTLKNFLLVDFLTKAEVDNIQTNYGEVNFPNVIKLRQDQFSTINNLYTFEVNEQGAISIFSNKKYVGYISEQNNINKIVNFDDITGVDKKVPTSISQRNKYITELVNEDLDKTLKNSLTITDLITDPTLLKSDVQSKIIDFMKTKYDMTISFADSESTFLYMSDYFVKNFKNKSIVLLRDGSYGLADITRMKNTVKEEFELNENTTVEDIFNEKYIPSGLKIKIVDGGDPHFSGYKTVDGILTIDNTIYIPKFLANEPEYMRWALAHEFHHAIQFEKNMNAGYGRWKSAVDPKVFKEIIKDVRFHMPQLFDKVPVNSIAEEDIVEQFVYFGSGESFAYGLGGSLMLDYYPVLIHNTPNGQSVVLPWGTEFKTNTKALSSKRSNIISKIQNLQTDENFVRLNNYRSTMNISALQDKANARDRYRTNIDLIYSSPAITNYLDKFLSINESGLKDLKSTILGNDNIRRRMIENLYVNLNFNHKYDRFLDTNISFVTIEYPDNNSNVIRIGFTDSDATSLSQQVMMYVNDKNLNINKIKVLKGEVKPKDILGYLNVNGYKQLFLDDKIKLAELSDKVVDSNLADFNDNEIVATYKGAPFWIARVNLKNGDIDKTWTYKEAEELNFDLAYSEDVTGNYVYFTTELLQDNNRIEYDDYGLPLSSELADKINKQIVISNKKTLRIDFEERYENWLKAIDLYDGQTLSDIDVSDPSSNFLIGMGVLTTMDDYEKSLVKKYRKEGKTLKESKDLAAKKAEPLRTEGLAIADYVTSDFIDSYTTNKISKYEREVESRLPENNLTPVNGVRPPRKNEVAEDDPRAKNFIKKEQSVHPTYSARYLVVDDKGNQVLDSKGKPVYNYAYPDEKTKTRKVAQNKWKGTKLEAFTKRYNVSQMSKEFQTFILNAEGLDPILQSKIDGKLKGTLTEPDVKDYLRSKDDIDDKTFKAINDAFYKNEYIDTFDELKELIGRAREAWTLWRIPKRYEPLSDYKEVLEDREMTVDLFKDIVLNFVPTDSEKETGAEKYFELEKDYDIVETRSGTKDLKIQPHYMRIALMKHYNGSIKSLRDAASAARIAVSQDYYNLTQQDNRLNETVYDAYEDALESIDDMSEEAIKEALAQRKLAQLASELSKKYSDKIPEIDRTKMMIEVLQYKNSIDDLSKSELTRLFNGVEGRKKATLEGYVADITGKYYAINVEAKPKAGTYVNQIKSAVNTMKGRLDEKQRKSLIHKYPDLFTPNFDIKKELYQNTLKSKSRPTEYVRYKSIEEVKELFEKVSDIKDEVLLGSRSMARELKSKQKENVELKRTIRKLEKGVKSDGKTPHVVEIITDSGSASLPVEKEMPLMLMKLLQVHYNKNVKTNVKNLSEANEYHKKRVANNFYENADKILVNLTQKDVDEIIDFFVNGIVNLNDATAPYQVAELLIMEYLIEIGRKGNFKAHAKNGNGNILPVNFVISAEQLSKLEDLLKKRVSRSATVLASWKDVLHKLDPVKTIQQSIARRAGVKATDKEIGTLLTAIESGDMDKIAKAKAIVSSRLCNRAMKKRASVKGFDAFLDKLLQWERLAMLSGPGTWARNVTSDTLIDGAHWTADIVMPGLDKILYKMFPKSQEVKGQYKIAGTKVDDNVAKYIESRLKKGGLLDEAISGISKYDTRRSLRGVGDASVLTEMLTNSIVSVANSNSLFTGKIWGNAEKWIKKAISDDPWVKKATYKYLGKMITEDLEVSEKAKAANVKIRQYNKQVRTSFKDIDRKVWVGKLKKLEKVPIKSAETFLSEDHLDKQFLVYVAEAYKMACYDYMHRSNALLDFESKLAHRNYKAYFLYKQVFPFAGVGWNWFVEGLNYTPVGLVKSIINFAKLENTVEKFEEARRTRKHGDIGPSSKFASYIVKRNITKGVIGSIGFVIGTLLIASGIARLDEEDDKYKVIVGNVGVDVSDLFGTQGIFLGMALAGSFKNGDAFDDVCIAALDQLFMDSTFSDVFNTFRYNETFGEFLMYQTYALPNMLVPNFLKTVVKISTVYEVQYSDGFLRNVERFAAKNLPGLAYFMPHYYDPYTGEKQIPNKAWYWEVGVNAVNQLSPLGLSVYNVSELERNAIAHGINKKPLTGKYTINDESIKLSSKDVESLNMYYGKLNVSSFKEIQSGREVFKIQQSNGTYKTVRWSQMTDKEKAAIIDRTMTNNSGYAKIYILTSSGKYRYYASDAEYKELKSLGITKNVYRATGKNKGFVKVN